jgi:enamine deaminase RidA (YjgF/YER057c/UK114 family)
MTRSPRRLISTGSLFEREIGYSRAVVQGDWCMVSGVTGYDYATMEIPEAIADQAENCFATLRRVLDEAGFEFGDLIQMRYLISDRALVDQAIPALGRHLGEIRPAATMVICDLMKPEMKIEIEAAAFRG